MERSEPVLVPQWLKASPLGFRSSSNSNSSGHRFGVASRSGNRRGRDSSSQFVYYLPSADRASSNLSTRNRISKSSSGHDTSIPTGSRSYSGSRRNNCNGDREKDIDFHEKKAWFVDNVSAESYYYSSTTNSIGEEAFRHSLSFNSVKKSEAHPKRSANTASSLTTTAVDISSSRNLKVSLERDFPSLGSKASLSSRSRSCNALAVGNAIGVSSSLGASTAAQNSSLSSSAMSGTGWRSTLASIPGSVEDNHVTCQISSEPLASMSGADTSLNMAEKLARSNLHQHSSSQLSAETRNAEEFAIKQSKQLIPRPPPVPKAKGFSSSGRLKATGSKGGSANSLTKSGLQSTSQLASSSVSGHARSDTKPSQIGNFQILNQKSNSFSSVYSDALNPANKVEPVSEAPPKNLNSTTMKVDYKTTAFYMILESNIDKKKFLGAQKRNDFFNSLRKKASGNPDQSPVCDVKGSSSSDSCLNCVPMDSDARETFCTIEEPEMFPPENDDNGNSFSSVSIDLDEEARFLRSLGWEENVSEEALTAEEINAFLREHKKWIPPSKLQHLQLVL